MSPARRCLSSLTTATAERGVEANEIEIANICLDMMNSSNPSEVQTAVRAGPTTAGQPAPPGPPHPSTASSPPRSSSLDTGSYIHVVVQKHRRARAPGTAPQRVARASSPLPPAPAQPPAGVGGAGDAPAVLLVPRSLFLACPNLDLNNSCCPLDAQTHLQPDSLQKNSKQAEIEIQEGEEDRYNMAWQGTGPECVKVYYFERGGGEYLRSSGWPCAGGGGGGGGALERAARRAAGPARRALAEALAAPRLLVATPLHATLAAARCALALVRAAAAGCVAALSDELLKPALALSFNALVQPPLVCAGQVARAAREALRPLWLALADALEPPARVLASLRLVDVHVHAPPLPTRGYDHV